MGVKRQPTAGQTGAQIIPFLPRLLAKRHGTYVTETGFILKDASLLEADPYAEDAENTLELVDELLAIEAEFRQQSRWLMHRLMSALYAIAVIGGIAIPLWVSNLPDPQPATVFTPFEQLMLERIDRAESLLSVWAVEDLKHDR